MAKVNDPTKSYVVQGTVVEGGTAKENCSPAYGSTDDDHKEYGQQRGQGEKGFGDNQGIQGLPLYEADTSSDADPESKTHLGKFVTQGYQDVWAAVLFLISVLITVYFGISNFSSNLDYLHTHKTSVLNTKGKDGKMHGKLKVDTVADDGTGVSAQQILLGALCITGLAVAAAVGILLILARYPRKAIIATNVAVSVIYLALSLYFFSHGVMWGGILCLIVSPLNLVWLYLVRDRIPFATAVLKIATTLIIKYKATVLCSIASVMVFYGYAVFNLSMSFPMLHRLGENKAESADPWLYMLCTLFFFWVAQVCINVVHVTVAGLVATWYFVGDDHMPPNPTLASFKRAMTTSFGSICFGSLLVAIIQTIRRAANMFANHENDFVRCIVDCILSILESLLEYFNTYAFVHVAIYGVSYIEAAKRTWSLAQECGWKAYFNDCLIEPTITLTSLGCACFLGGSAWLVSGGNVAVAVTTFIAVLAITLTVLRCVESAVPTIFVCFAELPSALLGSNPELYHLMRADGAGAASDVV